MQCGNMKCYEMRKELEVEVRQGVGKGGRNFEGAKEMSKIERDAKCV